jgi:hypothetical protein
MRPTLFQLAPTLLLGVVAVAASGCSEGARPTEPTVREPAPAPALQIQMAPGERVTVPGTSLTLTFEQIEHPLHPGLVDCVAGVPCGPFGASARFQVRPPTDPGYRTYLYLTQPADRNRMSFDGYGIRLVRFVPDYDPATPLPASAYSVVFAITP